jgi:hypothetical protein
MSGCADLCLYTEYDNGPDFHSTRTVKAAKPHQCTECRAPIERGEHHEVVAGKWDGEFITYRTCLACVEIRTTFSCGGWVYGSLWEDVEGQMFPLWGHDLLDVECLARVETPAAEAKLRARYAAWRAITSEDA